MTLREIITEELLNAVGHPEELENISRTYSRSKGPYYAALLDATSQLQDQLEDLSEEISDTNEQKKMLVLQGASLEEQRDELAQEVQVQEERLDAAGSRVAEVQAVLNHADQLAQRGFGQEELNRLYELLAQIAADQAVPAEQGVEEFFKTMSRYEHIVSLDLEATRAESRAAQAKAEAESRGRCQGGSEPGPYFGY